MHTYVANCHCRKRSLWMSGLWRWTLGQSAVGTSSYLWRRTKQLYRRILCAMMHSFLSFFQYMLGCHCTCILSNKAHLIMLSFILEGTYCMRLFYKRHNTFSQIDVIWLWNLVPSPYTWTTPFYFSSPQSETKVTQPT